MERIQDVDLRLQSNETWVLGRSSVFYMWGNKDNVGPADGLCWIGNVATESPSPSLCPVTVFLGCPFQALALARDLLWPIGL